MDATITVDTFLPWLIQESRKIARTTRTGVYLTDELWMVTLEALAWLRDRPADERADVLERSQQCLITRQVEGMPMPEDERERTCFVIVVEWIVNPPPVL